MNYVFLTLLVIGLVFVVCNVIETGLDTYRYEKYCESKGWEGVSLNDAFSYNNEYVCWKHIPSETGVGFEKIYSGVLE